jgi:hypothetical protein
MSKSILIMGESGTGKTTSFRNLNPAETFIVNVSRKDLPFKGWAKKYSLLTKENEKGNRVDYYDTNKILKTMDYVSKERPEIKFLIIDDTNYTSSETFFKRHSERTWDMWNDIGAELGKLILKKDDLREDLTIIYCFHVEAVDDILGKKKIKAKTLGSLVDKYLSIEGKFSIVLHSVKEFDPIDEITNYYFYTNDLEGSGCKSPMGMFDKKIENDMKKVIDRMIEYSDEEDN